MQRRREVQEKYHLKQPPALRMDSKMESTSAKMLKLIRPSRYIETIRFKRKAWARKRVVSNPFLYGEGSFSEDDKSTSFSLCSPNTSLSEEEVFESNEELYENVYNNTKIYENVYNNTKMERQRNESACVPENSQNLEQFVETFSEREDLHVYGDIDNVNKKQQQRSQSSCLAENG